MLHQPQSQSLTSAQFLTTAALAGNCCDCGFVVEGAPLFEEAGDADAVLGRVGLFLCALTLLILSI